MEGDVTYWGDYTIDLDEFDGDHMETLIKIIFSQLDEEDIGEADRLCIIPIRKRSGSRTFDIYVYEGWVD